MAPPPDPVRCPAVGLRPPMMYYPISTLTLAGSWDVPIISTLQDLPNFHTFLGDKILCHGGPPPSLGLAKSDLAHRCRTPDYPSVAQRPRSDVLGITRSDRDLGQSLPSSSVAFDDFLRCLGKQCN